MSYTFVFSHLVRETGIQKSDMETTDVLSKYHLNQVLKLVQ